MVVYKGTVIGSRRADRNQHGCSREGAYTYDMNQPDQTVGPRYLALLDNQWLQPTTCWL